MTGYIKFREDDYEDEDDLLQVMLEFQRRKEELRIGEKEWHAVWMLMKVQKRKEMEDFQYQTLRDVLMGEGDRLKEFADKYREVKVQTSRKMTVNAQYATAKGTGEMNTRFMGTESRSRRRSHEARAREARVF